MLCKKCNVVLFTAHDIVNQNQGVHRIISFSLNTSRKRFGQE